MKQLRRQEADFAQISRFVAGAEKKLAAAKKIRAIDEEASYQLAYEAMLKASLGFLLSHGVRPRSFPGHHVAIIEFAAKRLGKEVRNLVALFHRMRRKRHAAIYDVAGFISTQEATEALETAERYIQLIRGEIQKKNPQARPL